MDSVTPTVHSAGHGPHDNDSFHHHHSHGPASIHPGHHHLLTVEDLSVSFRSYSDGRFFEAAQVETQVISGLSLSVHEGEILAVVGASGAGKTLLADAILGLFEPNATVRGRIWFDGQLQDASSLARLRGRAIALVPQSVESLDPLMKVGRQVEGQPQGRADAAKRRLRRQQLFARYDLDESVASLYPHQLSGGMARRVLLCCALMEDPKLVVADEPTPGLDLPLALKAMEDFRFLAQQGTGVLLITHDIELALKTADRVAVFKDGTVVEETSVESFASPQQLRHPFSRALWHALPEHDFAVAEDGSLPGATSADSGQLPVPMASAIAGAGALVNETTPGDAAGTGDAAGAGCAATQDEMVRKSDGEKGGAR